MKRRRILSEEEQRLWAAIARSARPLPGKRMPKLPPEPAISMETALAPLLPQAEPSPPAGPGRAPGGAPALGRIDRPVRRKLGRGRIDIDDRIDLHGKTEAVAHYALLNFLRSAHAGGMRHVLVITGRGASLGSSGALKRAFPHWIATDAFRRLVSGFEIAERAHGGEGAYYVRLRRS